jgi:hypothetical protein
MLELKKQDNRPFDMNAVNKGNTVYFKSSANRPR